MRPIEKGMTACPPLMMLGIAAEARSERAYQRSNGPTDDQENVREEPDDDTNPQRLVSSKPGVREVTTKKRSAIGEETEQDSEGRGGLEAETESSCALLSTLGRGPLKTSVGYAGEQSNKTTYRRVPAFRKRALDKVGEDTSDTIVRGIVRPVNEAENEAGRIDLARNAAKGGFLFLGRSDLIAISGFDGCQSSSLFVAVQDMTNMCVTER